MKIRNYRRRIATFGLTMSIATLAIIGCGNQSTANDSNQSVAVESTQHLNGVVTQEDSKAKVKGKISDGANKLVVLQKLENGQLSFVDSVRADDKGRYELNSTITDMKFYYVTINSNQPPGVPIILEDGKSVELNLTIGEFIETTVKGDDNNDELKALYDLYLSHNKANAALQKRYSNLNPANVSDSIKFAFNTEYTSLQKTMSSDILNFVNEHKGGPATYFAATYVVPKPDGTLLESALSKLKKDAPESSFTKKLEDRLNSIGALDIGGLAPEIELASPTGELVKLSSLRGKVVLIDFWASWCRPCRQENPNVVRVYNEYHDKGFEVFSVSLDNDASRWKAAIAQDGLTWTHVSDLKGWKSSAAGLYQVSGIPKTFLLDRNGRILAKDLRGYQLEAKLAEIFN